MICFFYFSLLSFGALWMKDRVGLNYCLHIFSPTAKRYSPVLVDGGVMEIVQRLINPSSNEEVSKLAQKLINAVTDYRK